MNVNTYYRLQVISLVLLDPSHSRSVIPSSESFFTSRTPCYLLSSLPMVFCGLLGLIHALFLHWEQTLYVFSPQKYLVLISSPRAVAAAILLIWLIPALTSGLPLIASSAFAKWRGFCYAPGKYYYVSITNAIGKEYPSPNMDPPRVQKKCFSFQPSGVRCTLSLCCFFTQPRLLCGPFLLRSNFVP